MGEWNIARCLSNMVRTMNCWYELKVLKSVWNMTTAHPPACMNFLSHFSSVFFLPIFPCSIGFVECPWRIESFMKDTFLYLRLLKRKLKIPLLWKWRWLAIRRWKSSGTSPIPTILSIRGPGGEASIRLCPNINLQSCNSFSGALMDGPMLSGGHSPQL